MTTAKQTRKKTGPAKAAAKRQPVKPVIKKVSQPAAGAQVPVAAMVNVTPVAKPEWAKKWPAFAGAWRPKVNPLTQAAARKTRLRLIWLGVLAVICAWLYLAGTSRYGLFDVDEAIFTQATREMLHNADREPAGQQAIQRLGVLPSRPAGSGVAAEDLQSGGSGDLEINDANPLARAATAAAMPTYNREPRYHKPPMIYWAQALLMQVLGEDSLWAARLPSGLGALGTIALLGWWIARMTGNRRWGLLASTVMALNLSFLVVGRAATADGLLNFFSLATTLSLLSQLYRPVGTLGEEGKVSRLAAVRTGLLAALGLLAKGPVALVPAATVALAVLLARRPTTYPDRRLLWQQLHPFWLAGVTVAGLVPWVALMVHQSGGAFFYEFIYVQNVQRFAGGFSNTQSHSYFYYVGVLLVGFCPWVLLLGRASWWAGRDLRNRLASTRPDVALPAVALVWAVVYVVLFSCSQTRLAHYIVPAYPALALLVAAWLDHYLRAPLGARFGLSRSENKVSSDWTRGVPGALYLMLLGGLLLAVNPLLEDLRSPVLTGAAGWLQSLLSFNWPPKDAIAWATLQQPIPLDAGVAFAGVVLLVCAAPAYLLIWHGRRRAVASGAVLALAFCWAVVLGLLEWSVLPVIYAYGQAPLNVLAGEIAVAPPEVPIIHLGLHKPSVLYLSQRFFLKLEKPLQLPDYLTAPRTLVLTEVQSVAGIRQEIGVVQNPAATIAAQDCRGGYCLLSIERK